MTCNKPKLLSYSGIAEMILLSDKNKMTAVTVRIVISFFMLSISMVDFRN